MNPNRKSTVRAINKFLDRYSDQVIVKRYIETSELPDSPYRQRKRSYEDSVLVECAVIEMRHKEMSGKIGGENLRTFEVCTNPDRIIKAFHPNNFDDPRIVRDPASILTEKDILVIRGLVCNITGIEKHGDDGQGPMWYVLLAKESLD